MYLLMYPNWDTNNKLIKIHYENNIKFQGKRKAYRSPTKV
jgi:hypothetical protein